VVNTDHHRTPSRPHWDEWILRPCWKKAFLGDDLVLCTGTPLTSVGACWIYVQQGLFRTSLPLMSPLWGNCALAGAGSLARKCPNYEQTEHQNGLKLPGNPSVRKNCGLTHMQLYCKGCLLVVVWLGVFLIASNSFFLSKLLPDFGVPFSYFAAKCLTSACCEQHGACLQDSLFTYTVKTIWMLALLTVLASCGIKMVSSPSPWTHNKDLWPNPHCLTGWEQQGVARTASTVL